MTRIRFLCMLAITPLVLSSASSVHAAQSPEFEVASVKAVNSTPENRRLSGITGGPGTNDPSRISYRLQTLRNLLLSAYELPDYQLSAPDWLANETYDVIATLPAETTKAQLATLLQNLLIRRFQMVIHREEKETDVYDLTVAKGGPKLARSADGSDPNARTVIMMTPIGDTIHLVGKHASMSMLAANLTRVAGRPVLDATRLTGNFEFNLGFSPESMQQAGLSTNAEPSAAELLPVALQHQTGLELKKRKAKIEILVIDRAEKAPTDN